MYGLVVARFNAQSARTCIDYSKQDFFEMQLTPWSDVREHGIRAANGSEFCTKG
jgi:hypothetical protein